MVPGSAEDDARDLYQVLQMAYERVKSRVEVSEFYLTGYSLGAFQSAFVAKLDEPEKVFNFKKVLMINPPVSLFNSVSLLDKMLDENIPGGINNFQVYFEELVEAIAKYYRNDVFVEFDEDLFYNIVKELRREGITPTGEKLPPLIGFAFRISSSNMIFASDIMTHSNLIVPRDLELSPLDSLNQYGTVVFRTTFVAYFDELFVPYYQKRQPGLTRQQLIDAMSLKAIEGYLASATKIGLIHNADDIIMEPGEMDELARSSAAGLRSTPRGATAGTWSTPTTWAT